MLYRKYTQKSPDRPAEVNLCHLLGVTRKALRRRKNTRAHAVHMFPMRADSWNVEEQRWGHKKWIT